MSFIRLSAPPYVAVLHYRNSDLTTKEKVPNNSIFSIMHGLYSSIVTYGSLYIRVIAMSLPFWIGLVVCFWVCQMRITFLVLLWQYGGCLKWNLITNLTKVFPKICGKKQALYFWLFPELERLFSIKLDMYSRDLSLACPTSSRKALADQKLYLFLNHSSGLVWKSY